MKIKFVFVNGIVFSSSFAYGKINNIVKYIYLLLIIYIYI